MRRRASGNALGRLSITAAHLTQQFSIRLEERVNERTRIARELHDTLLQSFQGALFEFKAARNLFSRGSPQGLETLDNAVGNARQAITEARNAIQDLRSTVVEASDLEHLLTIAARELAASPRNNGHSPAFRAKVEGVPRALVPIVHDEVYRIGRELLRNAFQHAQASRIETEIRYDSRLFRLRIRDNGKGIDREVLREGVRAGHWGLPGIHERAKRLGARLAMWSEIGVGTEVELTLAASIAYGKSAWPRRLRLFRNKSEAL